MEPLNQLHKSAHLHKIRRHLIEITVMELIIPVLNYKLQNDSAHAFTEVSIIFKYENPLRYLWGLHFIFRNYTYLKLVTGIQNSEKPAQKIRCNFLGRLKVICLKRFGKFSTWAFLYL